MRTITSPGQIAHHKAVSADWAARVLALLLLFMPALAQAQFNFTTNFCTITITEYTGPGGEVTIPETINDILVDSIGPWAFANCTNLTRVTFPDTVFSIEASAFINCVNLSEATLPQYATSIGDNAFAGCAGLGSVAIGSELNSIGELVFDGCPSLTNITVDPGNLSFSSLDGVLFDATQTTLVLCPQGFTDGYVIPGTVTNIGRTAFFGCAGLSNITIPNSITNIGDNAFAYCSGLTDITIPDGIMTLGTYAFWYCTNLANVTLPESLILIGDEAFQECSALSHISIGSQVTRIGSGAFQDCGSLMTVAIPGSVTNIGDYVFSGCTNLASITVDPQNSFYRSADGVLFDKSGTTLIVCPSGKSGAYTVPNGVTEIVGGAFGNCNRLTAVALSSTVTSIWYYVFDTPSLASITVDASNPVFSSLDGVLFDKNRTTLLLFPKAKSGNYGLPSGVSTIPDWAFFECTGLVNVTLPSTVVTLGAGAFDFCTNLVGIYFNENAPRLGNPPFLGGNNVTIYYLPGTTGWSATFGGRPAVLWNPQAQNTGVQANGFGFTITGANDLVIVVEACTDLAHPAWSPVSTNTLTGGSSYFNDPQWASYPSRFYRFRSP